MIHFLSLRVAEYVRVSTDRQARDGWGLEAQRDEIRRWAKANGHRIVSCYADEGISGSNGIDAREGLFDAIAALKAGSADAVVFTSLDRLARKMTEQEGILGEIWSAGGIAVSLGDGGEVLEDDPDDPMRTAIRQMRGVFAQLERGLIRQRMRKGKQAKAAEGGYTGGAPPFGYRGGNGDLVPDPFQRTAVDRILALHRDGRSLRSIIQVLKAEGHNAKRGQWHPTSVARIIRRGGDHDDGLARRRDRSEGDRTSTTSL